MSRSEDCAAKIKSTIEKILPELGQLYKFGQQDVPNRVVTNYPLPENVIKAHKLLLSIMLPGKYSPGPAEDVDLNKFLSEHLTRFCALILPELEKSIPFRWQQASAHESVTALSEQDSKAQSESLLSEFVSRVPKIREFIVDDVVAAYEGDPAALSYAEVKLAYPGLLAVVSHRIAHELYQLEVPIIPRIMSEWAHGCTGTDINPGAQIGRRFFIDHATGVVIGETTVIGNRVKIYQGVTLGAKSFPLDEFGRPVKHIRRHPTVEDDVVIYANATILGGDTIIGTGSVIGGNVFVLSSVPPGSTVTYSNVDRLRLRESDS